MDPIPQSLYHHLLSCGLITRAFRKHINPKGRCSGDQKSHVIVMVPHNEYNGDRFHHRIVFLRYSRINKQRLRTYRPFVNQSQPVRWIMRRVIRRNNRNFEAETHTHTQRQSHADLELLCRLTQKTEPKARVWLT